MLKTSMSDEFDDARSMCHLNRTDIRRKSIQPVKKLSAEVWVWLSVLTEVQTVCICPADAIASQNPSISCLI